MFCHNFINARLTDVLKAYIYNSCSNCRPSARTQACNLLHHCSIALTRTLCFTPAHIFTSLGRLRRNLAQIFVRFVLGFKTNIYLNAIKI